MQINSLSYLLDNERAADTGVIHPNEFDRLKKCNPALASVEFELKQEKLLSYPTPFNNRPVEGMNLASFIKGKIIYMHDDFRELKNE